MHVKINTQERNRWKTAHPLSMMGRSVEIGVKITATIKLEFELKSGELEGVGYAALERARRALLNAIEPGVTSLAAGIVQGSTNVEIIGKTVTI